MFLSYDIFMKVAWLGEDGVSTFNKYFCDCLNHEREIDVDTLIMAMNSRMQDERNKAGHIQMIEIDKLGVSKKYVFQNKN